MQHPTLPPWLAAWPGALEHKLTALDYYRALARHRQRQRSRLTFYYGDEHRYRYPFTKSAPYKLGWGAGTVRPLVRWERVPLVAPAPDLAPLPGGSIPAGGAGRAALHAWAGGAALLLLALALLRAADRCLGTKLLNFCSSSRRRSEEWSTPNVCATSRHTIDNGTVLLPGLEDEPLNTASVDPPPPYCECATAPSTANKPDYLMYEDPPPAYSDTYVEFSNKNGVPSVLIFSRKRSLLNRNNIGSEPCSVQTESCSISNDIEHQNEPCSISTDIDHQNAENASTEIANEAARMTESNENSTSTVNVTSNNAMTSTDLDTNDQAQSVSIPSTSEAAIESDIDDQNARRNSIVLV